MADSWRSLPGPENVARYELENGIVLLVRENDTSPSVVITGSLLVGAVDEPAEQAGLAAFTAACLDRGTERRSFEQIYEEVESIGAAIHVAGGGHVTHFVGKSLAEDLPRILDVLADLVRHPTFPEEQVEKVRGEILTALAERANNTQAMAALAFQEVAYPPDHPYSRSARGYPETIQRLRREDLVRFYREGYGPRGMIVAVVGAVQAETVRSQIEAAFGDWEGGGFRRDGLPEAPPPTEVRRKVVPMPGKVQSDIVLGVPGPPRTHPDFLTASLANTIFGVFGMYGRLGRNVRDEQGLAYYAFSRLDGGMGPGPWRVIAGVHPTNVRRTVESIRQEIRRMRDEPVPAEELEDNKAYITGSLPLRLETNEGVAGALIEMERYGLGLDYLRRYPDLIRAITAEEIQQVVRRWLDPDAFALGIAGPPEEAS